MSHSFRELENGIVVVELAGKLIGGSGAEGIPRDVRVRIDDGKRRFIFDFHEVTYADSTGIGAVLKAFSALAEVGGRMVFTRVNKRIHQVLSIMRLDTVIQIFETEEQAVQALGENQAP
jgi:anti-sigma B factor antagonist